MGGKNPGYLQFVLLFWVFLSHVELIALGVYVANAGSAATATAVPTPVGRQPNEADTTMNHNLNEIWEEKRQQSDATYEHMIAPKQQDFEKLGESLLSLVARLLDAMSEGKFPSLVDSRQMCESNNDD